MDKQQTKAYGRGGSKLVIDNVFCQKPESDPYLFESDDDCDEGPRRSQPLKKKSKVSSLGRPKELPIDRKVKQMSESIVHKARLNTANKLKEESQKHEPSRTKGLSADERIPSRAHNTRSHLPQGKQEKILSTRAKNLYAGTVKKSEEATRCLISTESDSENSEPIKPKSERACRSRSQSPQKSGRSLRSSQSSEVEAEDMSAIIHNDKEPAIVKESKTTNRLASNNLNQPKAEALTMPSNPQTSKQTVESSQLERSTGLSQEIDDFTLSDSEHLPGYKSESSDSPYDFPSPIPEKHPPNPKYDFNKFEKKKSNGSVSKPLKKLLSSPGKSPVKYRYNHRAWLDEPEDQEEEHSDIIRAEGDKPQALKRPLEMRKVTHYPMKLGDEITVSVKVHREQKPLYTVVRNVRQAHECQDHGETQQIDDDLEFLLEGLEPSSPVSSRFLSAISLAKKCTNATFRMYLRAQGSLKSIFSSMRDSLSDPRLALSATTIMFMLCQDRLNMDLDRESLKLLVHLLEYDYIATFEDLKERREYEKGLDTVFSLYRSCIPEGEELIDKSDLSPGYLAMECLLVLTSRKSGDWFKEELREVGAVVTIANSIIEKTTEAMKVDYDMELPSRVTDVVNRICRYLRVLEHVTAFNQGNQKHIIRHQSGEFVISLCRLLTLSTEALPTHYVDSSTKTTDSGYLLLQLLLGVLRVLVNTTHDSETGCAIISTFDGLTDTLLKCILQTPQFVLEEQRFDMLVLGVGLLINICENSSACRQRILEGETMSSYDSISESMSMNCVEAFVCLFNQRLRAAEKIEADSGQFLESPSMFEHENQLNESLTEVLHKAGRHMEDTIVASYVALLLGVIIQHSPDYSEQIKEYLVDNSFNKIIKVLEKFHQFMKMTDAVSGSSGSKSIDSVVKYLKEYS